MNNQKGFTPLEIGIPNRERGRLPERRGETDVRKRHRSFLTGFTLIELLVVIAIIALLMSILMPALARVKQQAKTIGCLANLKQWTLYFSMYTEDHEGKFQAGVGDGHTHHWMNALRPYYKNDPKMRCCPTAMKSLIDENGQQSPQWNVFSAWGRFWGQGYELMVNMAATG